MNYFPFLILLFLHQINSDSGFSYTSSGDDWGGTCGTGVEQSPIDIETDSVTKCDPYMLLDINWKDELLEMETEDLGTIYYLLPPPTSFLPNSIFAI